MKQNICEIIVKYEKQLFSHRDRGRNTVIIEAAGLKNIRNMKKDVLGVYPLFRFVELVWRKIAVKSPILEKKCVLLNMILSVPPPNIYIK